MFEFLKKDRQQGPQGAEGYRLYAIGDVHGRLDLLDGLLQQIADDNLARNGGSDPVLVFLGDLIDRGPQSAQVLDRLLTGPMPGFRSIYLEGNHEEVLLRLLDGEHNLLTQWLNFGGTECLQSYGVEARQLLAAGETEALRRLRDVIPEAHRRFLHNLVDSFSFGDYLFVHAGLRPGVPLKRQSPADLRWIRDAFLEDTRDHGCVVVHGHTISETIDERPNRIGIDTGAYATGVLTALCVDGPDRWFLQERAPVAAEDIAESIG